MRKTQYYNLPQRMEKILTGPCVSVLYIKLLLAVLILCLVWDPDICLCTLATSSVLSSPCVLLR